MGNDWCPHVDDEAPSINIIQTFVEIASTIGHIDVSAKKTRIVKRNKTVYGNRLTTACSHHVAGPSTPWAEQRSVARALARVACLDAAVAARVARKALTKAAVAVGPAAAPMA